MEVLRELANSVGGGAVGNTSGSSIFGTSGAQNPSGPYLHALHHITGAVKPGDEGSFEGALQVNRPNIPARSGAEVHASNHPH